jgi:membrane protease YdiL (CAAX protease family)
MNSTLDQGPLSMWRTVGIVWRTGRLRAAGRGLRQRQLMQQRRGKPITGLNPLGGFATLFAFLIMASLHVAMAYQTLRLVEMGSLADTESKGHLVIMQSTFDDLKKEAANTEEGQRLLEREAEHRVGLFGGDRDEQKALLKEQYEHKGLAGFVSQAELPTHLSDVTKLPPTALLCGSIMLLWWLVMILFQGEGLEMDMQRRRHPMWEWLLSHPIHPQAAFLADMISPLAANPVYLTAPIYWMVVLGSAFDGFNGIAAGLLVGIFVSVAAACINKTLELCAMLRLSVRSRGALLGIMSWVGYVALLVPIFMFGHAAIPNALAHAVESLSGKVRLPLLEWSVGMWGQDVVSLGLAVAFAVGISAVAIVLCLLATTWGASRGLEGGTDRAPTTPRMLSMAKSARFGKEPLYRKELLWFSRDRGALVQAVLIPLSVAAIQATNFRQMLQAAGHNWNALCALGIIGGTYFLLILGPRSLSSEGPALWLALTWPRGMEDLLKAKARLWWIISSAVVYVMFLFVAFRFPAEAWKVGLTAAGWWIFGRSLAEKAVTLVRPSSSSGQPEPAPRSQQWTAMLGTLTFGSGVMAQNWHLAVIGVVFSMMTSAAMWQNLRARLPFLYDPWSEKFPPPPTLLHAMIGIAAMVEGISVIMAFLVSFGGPSTLLMGRAIAYGVGALLTFWIMHRFLSNRGVKAGDIWTWAQPQAVGESGVSSLIKKIASKNWSSLPGTGVLLGLALGLVAAGYLAVLRHLPYLGELLHQQQEALQAIANGKLWMAVLAVGFAPIAEEYLFRGMLYRALDREWGGWRAMIGSAAFFAIYHPPLSWLPVASLGVLNAWLFKKSGRLAPCVLCHMAYNAVVVFVGN